MESLTSGHCSKQEEMSLSAISLNFSLHVKQQLSKVTSDDRQVISSKPTEYCSPLTVYVLVTNSQIQNKK